MEEDVMGSDVSADQVPAPGVSPGPGVSPDEVAAVRAFNRFYTNVIGLVQGLYLDMPYPLTEARLLFELARRDVTPVPDLRRVLDIDPGYLSRVLSRFEADGLITRARSGDDARRQEIRLTADGTAAAAELDRRSVRQIGTLLEGTDRGRLLTAMREISSLLGDKSQAVVIRPPRPGDLGWIVQRHGAVYATEFGWNGEFEAWVARIIADYAASPGDSGRGGNPRGAVWIAEVDGLPAGSVMCVPDPETASGTARLRVLLVENWARGLGIGSRLVDEVLRFARMAGYTRVTLSTYDTLTSARRIYQAAGFTLRHENRERAFGAALTAQEWALDL
jgi:DNA-binding MarR family transcriptional regulator/GNAT superfamily N-acetyltransferase